MSSVFTANPNLIQDKNLREIYNVFKSSGSIGELLDHYRNLKNIARRLFGYTKARSFLDELECFLKRNDALLEQLIADLDSFTVGKTKFHTWDIIAENDDVTGYEMEFDSWKEVGKVYNDTLKETGWDISSL